MQPRALPAIQLTGEKNKSEPSEPILAPLKQIESFKYPHPLFLYRLRHRHIPQRAHTALQTR